MPCWRPRRGDIGAFPASTPTWRGASSDRFLADAANASPRRSSASRRDRHRRGAADRAASRRHARGASPSCGRDAIAPGRSRRRPPRSWASPVAARASPRTRSRPFAFRETRRDVRSVASSTLPRDPRRGTKPRALTSPRPNRCTGGLIAGDTHRDRRLVDGRRARLRHLFECRQDRDARRAGRPHRALGAVSEEVALAMAEGALSHSLADLSVAVTGIAGPGGGSAEKPVGLVHFAVARAGAKPRSPRSVASAISGAARFARRPSETRSLCWKARCHSGARAARARNLRLGDPSSLFVGSGLAFGAPE